LTTTLKPQPSPLSPILITVGRRFFFPTLFRSPGLFVQSVTFFFFFSVSPFFWLCDCAIPFFPLGSSPAPCQNGRPFYFLPAPLTSRSFVLTVSLSLLPFLFPPFLAFRLPQSRPWWVFANRGRPVFPLLGAFELTLS